MKSFLNRVILILIFLVIFSTIKSQNSTEKDLLDSVYTYLLTEIVTVAKREYYTYFDNGKLHKKNELYPYVTDVLGLVGSSIFFDFYFTVYESSYDIKGNLVSKIKKQDLYKNHWSKASKLEYFYNSNNMLDSITEKRARGFSFSTTDNFDNLDSYTKNRYEYDNKSRLVFESNTVDEIGRYIRRYFYNEKNQLSLITDSSFFKQGDLWIKSSTNTITQYSYTDTIENTYCKDVISSVYYNDKLQNITYRKRKYSFNEQNLLHVQIDEVFDTSFRSWGDTTHYKVKLQKEYNTENKLTNNKLFSWNEKTASWDFLVDEQTKYREDGNIIKFTREEFDDYNKLWKATIMSEYYYSNHTLISEFKTIFAETFKIFPNPASHSLNIVLNKSYNLCYEIFDLKGKIMLKGILNDESINISSLKKGMYIVRLFNDKIVMQQKFINISH